MFGNHCIKHYGLGISLSPTTYIVYTQEDRVDKLNFDATNSLRNRVDEVRRSFSDPQFMGHFRADLPLLQSRTITVIAQGVLEGKIKLGLKSQPGPSYRRWAIDNGCTVRMQPQDPSSIASEPDPLKPMTREEGLQALYDNASVMTRVALLSLPAVNNYHQKQSGGVACLVSILAWALSLFSSSVATPRVPDAAGE